VLEKNEPMKKLREYIQHLGELKQEENERLQKEREVKSSGNKKENNSEELKQEKQNENPWNVKWVIE
jgi:hypothetical protein